MPNKFRQFCKENSLSADMVAERIGCSKYTVYAYWRGERRPHWKVMKKMDEAFGIDSRSLFEQ